MIKTPIYIVTVTIIKFLKSDIYPDYSTDKLMYHVDSEKITSIHLLLEGAEVQKDNLTTYCQEEDLHIFSVIIDEYEDGAIISDKMPNERWIYDKHGELVDLQHNNHGQLSSSSVLPAYSKGDMVEVLSNSDTLHLGIIVKTPNDLSKESDGNRVLDDIYEVLTGPYIEDDNYYKTSQLRQYDGNIDEVSFMQSILSQYPKLLPHVD